MRGDQLDASPRQLLAQQVAIVDPVGDQSARLLPGTASPVTTSYSDRLQRRLDEFDLGSSGIFVCKRLTIERADESSRGHRKVKQSALRALAQARRQFGVRGDVQAKLLSGLAAPRPIGFHPAQADLIVNQPRVYFHALRVPQTGMTTPQ